MGLGHQSSMRRILDEGRGGVVSSVPSYTVPSQRPPPITSARFVMPSRYSLPFTSASAPVWFQLRPFFLRISDFLFLMVVLLRRGNIPHQATTWSGLVIGV